MAKKLSATELISPDRKNWQLHRRSDAKRYALSLFKDPRTAVKIPGTDIEENGFIHEFEFNVNPSDMDLEEPAAVTIVPTQNQGQFIEHQGSIFKNISISGTTGMRPNKKATGAFTPSIINPDTLLPGDEKTGFDDLVELVNFFRRY